MDALRVILLGTGTSHGIPMIGCDCAVCTSADPRDKRTRTSILAEANGQVFLVDTPPELRIQCLACDVTRVDAVLYTHYHTDHVAGLDDLRRFNALQGKAIRCFGNQATVDALRRMFGYAFMEVEGYPSEKPDLQLSLISEPISIGDMRIVPIALLHGDLPILGYRFGSFAYCTDCSEIPDESFALLKDLDVLVLDGLRRRPHPTHFNLEQAVAVAGLINARRTFFTHIAHELGHEATNAELPDDMALGYDGQVITIDA